MTVAGNDPTGTEPLVEVGCCLSMPVSSLDVARGSLSQATFCSGLVRFRYAFRLRLLMEE